MLKINENEMQKLCRHAANEYPKECCGILLGNKKREVCRKSTVQEMWQTSTGRIHTF